MQNNDHMQRLAEGLPLYSEPQPMQLHGQPIASAKLAEPGGLAKLLPFDPNKFVIGGDGEGNLLCHGDDCHVGIWAGTRSGKGTDLSGTLLLHEGSLFHSSSKVNEVCRLAARRGAGDKYCDGLGQNVGVADPFNLLERFNLSHLKVSVNVIGDWLNPSDPLFLVKAKRLAVCVKPMQAGQTDPYFDDDSRRLIGLTSAHVSSSPLFEGRRTFGMVYKLIQEGDVEVFNQLKKEGKLQLDKSGKPIHDPTDVFLMGMVNNSYGEGEIAAAGRYFEIIKKAEKQWGGVVGSAVTALGFLDISGMRELFGDGPSYDLGELKFNPQGASFFCVMEEGMMEDCGACPRILYAVLEDKMKQPGRPATGHQTIVWLDEFGVMKRLDTIENGMASLAGYGIKLVIMCQTMDQIKKHYGEEGLSIFESGITLRLFQDTRDLFTARRIKEYAGEKEVIAMNRSVAVAKGEQKSHTKGGSVQVTGSHTKTENTTDGTHESEGDTFGQTRNDSFNGSLMTWLAPKVVPRFIKKWWSVSLGTNFGTSRTTGSNHADAKGTSDAIAVAVGSQESDTEGENKTVTGTLTENLQVRPLLPIETVVDKYSKLNPDGGRTGLCQITGIGFFEFERIRPWEHPAFWRTFSKDPDHPYLPAPKPAEVVQEEEIAIQQSPAVISEAKAEIVAYESGENYSTLANGLKWVFATGGVLFTVVGAPLLSLPMALGYFASRQVSEELSARKARINRLELRVLNAKHKGTAGNNGPTHDRSEDKDQDTGK